MKHFQSTAFFFFLFALVYAQNDRVVIGKISNGDEPLINARVQVLNGGPNASSLEDGSYTIPVETGDVLAYHASGMKPVNIKVEDVTRVLNIELSPRIEKLKNVTVTKEKTKKSNAAIKKNQREKDLIRTAFGTIDKSRVAYPVRTLEADDILDGEYNLRNVLRGRFPGLRFANGSRFTGNSAMVGRRISTFTDGRNFNSIFLRGRTPAIFDIDGQLFTDFPDFLEVQNIERIAVIPSLAGTLRYGSMGQGGVVVINTKTGSPATKAKSSPSSDNTGFRNPYYNDTKLASESATKSMPSYLKTLKLASSFDDAKDLYEKDARKYRSSPYFVIDAYKQFYDKWKAVDYADDIVEDADHLFENNAVLLKALAYIYEEQGRHDMAYNALRKAFILRPSYAQSYLDLANSNRNLNKMKRAAVLYTRYFYLLKEGFMQADTNHFSTIMRRDFDNLIKLNRTDVVKSDKIGKISVEDEKFNGTRLMFEWNDGEAEFDIQFVNSSGQYYTWKHNRVDNLERIKDEKNKGFSCHEQLIYDPVGTWEVNIKYLGNKSLTPTYLKATAYFNYGTDAQRKEVKVFKLTNKNVNHKLFDITKGNAIMAE